MKIVSQTATAMQRIFGTVAEKAGQDCELIRRQRKFTAATLVQTLVLGFLRKPNATDADLAATASVIGVHVTQQAVGKRWTPALVQTLRKVWESAVQIVISTEPLAIELLQRFTEVRIGDSTTIQLPDEVAHEFPGCGGSSGFGKAALKIQVTWDFLHGSVRAWLQAGSESDVPAADPEALPQAGSLSLFDLGYFCLERFRRWGEAGAYWISRLQPHTRVYTLQGELLDLLSHLQQTITPGRPFDQWILVGQQQLPCRLIALRVPEEVAAKRRQKAYERARKKGRTPSQEYLNWCQWTIFITNCETERFTWKEIVVLYRTRWQIELLFKLWKSHSLLAESNADSADRQMAELFAKMIAVIIQHWILLSSVGVNVRRSFFKAARQLRQWAILLIRALRDPATLCQTLQDFAATIAHLCRNNPRIKHPGTIQLLLEPELLNYATLS